MNIFSILIASLCTSLGAIPALFIHKLLHKVNGIILAYTAGIMVAASAYGLIPSALKLSNLTTLVIGILFGTFVLTLLDLIIPHKDLALTSSPTKKSNILLFVIAISLHNLPEGLSVGITNVSNIEELGSIVSFAIAFQNIPEGFLIALFLITQGVNKMNAFVLSSLTGLAEFCAGLVGIMFGQTLFSIIPYGLAFAAGAMLFVVYKELIPESLGNGNERASTITFILGLITMICLTEWLN